MRYVTSAEMKELDQKTIGAGTPAATLMENAGKAVADEAVKTADRGTTFVFCGYGNNGGDGFVAARYLAKKGYCIKAFLVGKPKSFSPEAQGNLDALLKLKIKPDRISETREIIKIFKTKDAPELVIDAIFGIGIKGSLEDLYMKLIEEINNIGAPIIAVDVPSGLDADTGEALPSAIKAYKTVTLGLPKAGFKNPKAKEYLGEVIVADIGLSSKDV